MELGRIGVELPDSARNIFRQGWCKLTPEQLTVFVDFLQRHPGDHGYKRLLSPEDKAGLSAKTAISDPEKVLTSLELTLSILNAKENPLKALDDLLDDLKTVDLLTEDAAAVLQPRLVTFVKDYRWIEPVEGLFASYVPIYSSSSCRCVVTPEFEVAGKFREIDLEEYSPTVKALVPAVLLGLRSVTLDEKTINTSYLLTEVDIDNLIKRLQIAKKQLLVTKVSLRLTDREWCNNVHNSQ